MDMTSTHGAWRHAEVQFLLPGDLIGLAMRQTFSGILKMCNVFRSSQLLKPSTANPFISGAPDIVQSVEAIWHKQREIEATKAHRNSETEAHMGIGENAGHVSPRQTILHVSVAN